jgi:D-3-phosphoglycerate dehydrogenase
MKVLIATEKPFAPVAVQGIREIVEGAGYELALLEKYTGKEELLAAVSDADAVIIRSDQITPEVLDAAKQLRIVVRAGAGYDNVDLDAATAKGVCVMNTPGQNSNAVAELALGMMVLRARNKYNGKPGTELKGKKVGIHAFGNVGKLVALIAQGFGMEVLAFDPFVPADEILAAGVTPVNSAEELYSKCPYVSLHIPANDKTRQSIGYELLKFMPANGTLVNTARKEVIHEDELLKLMAEREDIFYASDIAPDKKAEFEEKFPDRTFFTPKKMGAQTAEANINAGLAAARQIIDYLENGIETFKVN